jgi:predicted enzyme related to lactoylglutathione lyase
MTTIPTGRFVWFDYVTNDQGAQDKAKAFYGELFNWKTQDAPMPTGTYTMIAAGGRPIGGYVPAKDAPNKPAHWISHLQVADVNATIVKIKTNGGSVKAEPRKMGDQGTMAIVADPFGATFALWQPTKPEGTGDYQESVGTWCWNELTAPDPVKAVTFYKAVGGFEERRMEMGPDSAYHILESDGKGRAGIAKPMKPDVPSMWMPYVHVGSTDQTHDKAKRLGAQVFVPPTDIPDIGRFAVFADPNGAAFAVLQPKM